MPLYIIIGAVLLLLLLTVKKLSPFLALLIVSVLTGLAFNMPVTKLATSIKTGVGNTLADLALILCLGAILGKILEVTGATQQITQTLIKLFGKKQVQWAVMLTGFIVGIPLFYNAGFIILAPLVFSIAAQSGVSILYVAIPMAASLSVTHGFLPPHPAPVALAGIFKANLGKTLLYGLIVSVPAIILGGPVLAYFVKRMKTTAINLKPAAVAHFTTLPSVALSFMIALLPVLLIAGATLFHQFAAADNLLTSSFLFVGEPIIALLIAVLAALYFLAIRNGKTMQQLMEESGTAISSVAMIMMVIACGGAFRQVLLDSSAGDFIKNAAASLSVSPLLLGWVVAALLRVTLGSATVAGITAAGIVSPIVAGGSVNPELMVLSVGAGSLFFSHVNDTGFWMFKEYFGLTMKQTFLSWTVMETIISLAGLLGVLLLNNFVQ